VPRCEIGHGGESGQVIRSVQVVNGKWWSNWVGNGRCPLVKFQVVGKVGGNGRCLVVKLKVVGKVGG
jgi:hypothetical protein